MNDKKISERYPLLFSESKYSAGMHVPAAEQVRYTLDEIKDRGAEVIMAETERIEERREFEWLLNTFNTIKNETISDIGHFATPKNFEDHLKLVGTLNPNQLRGAIEDFENEIENTLKIGKMRIESVFSDKVKQDIERDGRAYIIQKRFGNTYSEEVRGQKYDQLVALTTEELSLLKEVADIFSKLKTMYQKELATRQAQTPDTLKTLTENLKNLVREGGKIKKGLEKACSKYVAAKTPENRALFCRLWDEFHAVEGQYAGVRHRLFATNAQVKPLEFPVLSHEAFTTHRYFL
jgi:hypothetical protein